MSTNLVDASVNAGGTRIATAKALGTSTKDTTKSTNDAHTFISHGGQVISVKAAIAMGILRRTSSGTLEELNPPQPYTRQG